MTGYSLSVPQVSTGKTFLVGRFMSQGDARDYACANLAPGGWSIVLISPQTITQDVPA